MVVETCNINRILVRNLSTKPCSQTSSRLEQTTLMSVEKERIAECRGVKGWFLGLEILTESLRERFPTPWSRANSRLEKSQLCPLVNREVQSCQGMVVDT